MNPRLVWAAASLLTPLVAQTPPGGHTLAPAQNMIPWPAGLGSGPLRKVAELFWDNVDHRSAVAVRGTTGGRAVAPGVTSYVAAFDVGLPIIDFVSLPGAGTAGSERRDALLASVLDPTELLLVRADPTGAIVTTPVSHPGWMRASAMDAQPDATGIDIAARAMDGVTLLRTRYDYVLQSLAQLPSLTLAEPILDLVVVDWNDDQLHDVAVLTDSALTVYDAYGAILDTISQQHPGGAIEPAPDPTNRGALAWLQRNANDDGWQLRHVMDGAIEAPIVVKILGDDFALGGMASGDINGDGDLDILVQDTATHAVALANGGATPFFDPANRGEMTFGNPGGSQARASMGDYDYDGAADALVPVTAPNGDAYLVLQTNVGALVEENLDYFPDVFTDCYHENQNGDVWTLRLWIPPELDFDRVAITYYSAIESQGALQDWATEIVPRFVHQIEPGLVEIDTPLPAGFIDNPSLMFAKVQFLNDDDASQKPSLFAGATIDDDFDPEGPPVQVSSTYLTNNALPNVDPKQVKRNFESSPGRKQIGLVAPQSSLPIK